jgi:hypothetical protein
VGPPGNNRHLIFQHIHSNVNAAQIADGFARIQLLGYDGMCKYF